MRTEPDSVEKHQVISFTSRSMTGQSEDVQSSSGRGHWMFGLNWSFNYKVLWMARLLGLSFLWWGWRWLYGDTHLLAQGLCLAPHGSARVLVRLSLPLVMTDCARSVGVSRKRSGDCRVSHMNFAVRNRSSNKISWSMNSASMSVSSDLREFGCNLMSFKVAVMAGSCCFFTAHNE